MDLDRLAVELRSRSDWEAVDLGFAMVRSWRAAIYAPWLAVAGPVALLAAGLGGPVGLLAFWWILPLFELVVLDVVSRAAFGETSPTAAVIRRVPRLWRQGWGEVFWRRVHPARSFRLPVAALEGAAGAVRRDRIQALESRGSDVPAWLTFGFFSFHVGLGIAAYVLMRWMVPSRLGVDWEHLDHLFWRGQATELYYLIAVLGALVLLMFNPIYVACGFAIYLNRRVDLEGWDLDLAFRRLDGRLASLGVPMPTRHEEPEDVEPDGDDGGAEAQDSTSRDAVRVGLPGSLVVGAVLGLMFLSSASGPIWAQDSQRDGGERRAGEREAAEIQAVEVRVVEIPTVEVRAAESQAAESRAVNSWAADSRAKTAMAEVAAMEELQTKRQRTTWQLREDLAIWEWLSSRESNRRRSGFVLPDFTQVIEWMLWAFVGLLVLWLIREGLKLSSEPSWTDAGFLPVESVLGLDIRRESLPDDVAGAAEALWHQGDRKEALRLLYRASLSRLHQQGMELRESFTENDCLQRARALTGPERFGFFAALTRVWQDAAYAHRLPELDAAQGLWQGWRTHFEAGGDGAAPREGRS